MTVIVSIIAGVSMNQIALCIRVGVDDRTAERAIVFSRSYLPISADHFPIKVNIENYYW